MDIFVYSDESGVFDKIHNDFFVFGGLILLGNDEKDIWIRKYAKAENDIRNGKYSATAELKAYVITNREKGKLYRSLNNYYKFAVVIDQKEIYNQIFADKKSKQRYLDFAYKIAIRKAFEDLIRRNIVKADEVGRIRFFIDEHTTATNGRYELKEALLQEFKFGTHNFEYMMYHAPIFSNLNDISLKFCDSKNTTLVRAADIIANKVYYYTVSKMPIKRENLYITYLPHIHNPPTLNL